jgi:DNA-binding NarL/FixJ family response regulator
MNATSVVIADDHPIVLAGLRGLLPGAGFRVVGDARSAGECVDVVARLRPDLLLLDLRLPDGLAPDVCRRLRMRRVDVRVVVLTAFADEALLQACLAEDVAGVLLKDTHEATLLALLERVRRGETVVDPRLDAAAGPGPAAAARTEAGITPREHDVLRLVARGMTSAQIAGELHLSVNTVRSYVQSILSKLGVHTRIEALARARRLRLI